MKNAEELVLQFFRAFRQFRVFSSTRWIWPFLSAYCGIRRIVDTSVWIFAASGPFASLSS